MKQMSLLLIAFSVFGVDRAGAAKPAVEDPLAPILQPVLRSSVEMLLENCRNGRKYKDEDFPMSPNEFAAFRNDVVGQMEEILGLKAWTVRGPQQKSNALAGLFQDELLETIEHHDVTMEVHLIKIPETGARVPAVLCLPSGSEVRPGICVFSGHTRHGLRDLVLDLNSYQRGIATRLAQAGFVSIAVEKIDTGYLSRDFGRGVDEPPIATTRLALGLPTRSHQLMACLAASEILAVHPRVDHERIGACGVSLGGWLSVETALLSDRIAAVADFGMKTMHVPPEATAAKFEGIRDMCHIMPGMLAVCDRNVHNLAYCPRPLLASHGRRDPRSSRESPVHFQQLFEKQYEALGKEDQYEYRVHGGGDTMDEKIVIDYFTRVLGD